MTRKPKLSGKVEQTTETTELIESTEATETTEVIGTTESPETMLAPPPQPIGAVLELDLDTAFAALSGQEVELGDVNALVLADEESAEIKALNTQFQARFIKGAGNECPADYPIEKWAAIEPAKLADYGEWYGDEYHIVSGLPKWQQRSLRGLARGAVTRRLYAASIRSKYPTMADIDVETLSTRLGSHTESKNKTVRDSTKFTRKLAGQRIVAPETVKFGISPLSNRQLMHMSIN